MPYFQYPWRLLSLVILITSALVAILVSQKKSRVLAVFLIVLTLIFYGGYTRPVKYSPRSDDFYLTNPVWAEGTATFGDSFATIWAPGRQAVRPEEKIEIIQGKGEIDGLLIEPTKYYFEVKAATPVFLKINTLYFPGWKVFVDEKEIPIDFTNGLINFQISEGKHLVGVEFRNTPIRTLANSISFLSLLFLIGTAIFLRDIRLRKNESCN